MPDVSGNLATCSYVFDGLMTRIRFSLADIAAASAKIMALKAQARAEAFPQPVQIEEAAPNAAETPADDASVESPETGASPAPEADGTATPEEAPAQE